MGATPNRAALEIAEAYGGAFTAFDIHGCAVAIQNLVERELSEAKAERDRLLSERDNWRVSSVCRELAAERDEWRRNAEDCMATAKETMALLHEAQAQNAHLRAQLDKLRMG